MGYRRKYLTPCTIRHRNHETPARPMHLTRGITFLRSTDWSHRVIAPFVAEMIIPDSIDQSRLRRHAQSTCGQRMFRGRLLRIGRDRNRLRRQRYALVRAPNMRPLPIRLWPPSFTNLSTFSVRRRKAPQHHPPLDPTNVKTAHRDFHDGYRQGPRIRPGMESMVVSATMQPEVPPDPPNVGDMTKRANALPFRLGSGPKPQSQAQIRA